MRQRLAPSPARTAISFLLELARASNKFATFAHAISSTKPTAPRQYQNGRRISPVSCVRSGTTLTPQLVLNSGYCCARRAPIVSISCLCLVHRDAGLQTRHGRSESSVTLAQLVCDLQRHPDVGGFAGLCYLGMCQPKLAGITPMTCVGLLVESDLPANDLLVAAKSSLPQSRS